VTSEPAAAKPTTPAEPDIKTVSLDSLPVMADTKAADDKPAAAPVKAAPEPRKVVALAPRSTPTASKVTKTEKAESAPPPPKHKAEPVAVEAPKPAPKAQPAPPPAGGESFLKSAIRSAIAADAAKH
jgi:hypothetical protein